MAKNKKINWKSKKTWKNALIIGLACITLVGAIVGLSALFRKSEETTKEINPTFAVGGLTEQGKYLETEESIYTEDAFACQGLDIELDFKSNISYRVFFYDVDKDFISSTTSLTSNYDEEITPKFSTYARIVITPNDDDKISWYEKNGYANQLTISVNKEQDVVYTKTKNTTFKYCVENVSNLTFVADKSINGTGAIVDTVGRACDTQCLVKVDGGETVELKTSILEDNSLSFAVLEFTADGQVNTESENHNQYFTSSIELHNNTEYVTIYFKNGDGTTSFSAKALEMLPTCVTIR